MCRVTTSSCQSAATSNTVKHSCAKASTPIASKQTFTFFLLSHLTISSARYTIWTHVALVQDCGTLCLDCCMTLATTLLSLDILWKHLFSRSTSAQSTIGALAIMRYTNPRFTYLQFLQVTRAEMDLIVRRHVVSINSFHVWSRTMLFRQRQNLLLVFKVMLLSLAVHRRLSGQP